MGEPVVPPSKTSCESEHLDNSNEKINTQGKVLVQDNLTLIGEEHALEVLEDDGMLSNQILIPENPPYQYNTRFKRRVRIYNKPLYSDNNSSSSAKKRVNLKFL